MPKTPDLNQVASERCIGVPFTPKGTAVHQDPSVNGASHTINVWEGGSRVYPFITNTWEEMDEFPSN